MNMFNEANMLGAVLGERRRSNLRARPEGHIFLTTNRLVAHASRD